MRQIGWALSAMASIGLSACGGLSLGDQFKYTSGEDSFTGEKTSAAEASVSGVGDPTATLKLTVTCKYDRQGKPDPWQNTLMDLTVVGNGEVKPQFADISLKIDDAQPKSFDAIKSVSKTVAADHVELFYVFATAFALPAEDQSAALALIATGSGSSGMGGFVAGLVKAFSGGGLQKAKTDEQLRQMLAQVASASKKLSVRYSVSGQPNTAEFDISSKNFRKVLSDCGWDQLNAPPIEQITDDRRSGNQDIPSRHTETPAQAILNDPAVKARLAQAGAPIAWTKDEDAQGMKDCWTASEDGADHTTVIDRYCVSALNNVVNVYDAGTDSYGPITPNRASEPGIGGNFYNIYGSFPVGEQASAQTNSVLYKIRQCGIQASSDYTYNYRGLAPNMMVVLSGPFPSAQSAMSELNRAKECSVSGYTKAADFIGGE